jgi:hypothetical protein
MLVGIMSEQLTLARLINRLAEVFEHSPDGLMGKNRTRVTIRSTQARGRCIGTSWRGWSNTEC